MQWLHVHTYRGTKPGYSSPVSWWSPIGIAREKHVLGLAHVWSLDGHTCFLSCLHETPNWISGSINFSGFKFWMAFSPWKSMLCQYYYALQGNEKSSYPCLPCCARKTDLLDCRGPVLAQSCVSLGCTSSFHSDVYPKGLRGSLDYISRLFVWLMVHLGW